MTQPNRQDWRHLHLWQFQPVRDVLVLAAAFGVIWLGYELSVVTVPMLLALLLAYLVEPIVERVTSNPRVGRARVAISLIVLAVLLIGVPACLGVSYSVVQGIRFTQSVAQSIDDVSKSVRNADNQELLRRVENRGHSWASLRDFIVRARQKEAKNPAPIQNPAAPSSPPADQADTAPHKQDKAETTSNAPPSAAGDQPVDMLPGEDEPSDVFRALEYARVWLTKNASVLGKNVLEAGGGVFSALRSAVGSIGNLVFGSFLTAFFFFFFCTGYGQVIQFWSGLLPERKKGRTLDLLRQMDVVISGFVRGRLTIATVMIGLYTLGFWLVGVPAAFIIGPITGVLTLIPYACGVMAPVAILLMWLDPAGGFRGNWWWIAFSPFAVFAFCQVMDDYVMTPRIQGKTTNMDTPSILFASIAGGSLAGFYGLLMAIPVAACIKILLREVFWPRFRQWARGNAPDVLPIAKE